MANYTTDYYTDIDTLFRRVSVGIILFNIETELFTSTNANFDRDWLNTDMINALTNDRALCTFDTFVSKPRQILIGISATQELIVTVPFKSGSNELTDYLAWLDNNDNVIYHRLYSESIRAGYINLKI